jgi:hypothetical protein
VRSKKVAVAGRTVVLVVSGGNASPQVLERIIADRVAAAARA